MNNQALAQLFYREVEKVIQNDTLQPADQVEALYRLLNILFVEITRPEKLHFSTLFARIAFACHKFRLEKQLQFYIHAYRKMAKAVLHGQKTEPHMVTLGVKVLVETILAVFREAPPLELVSDIPIEWPYPFSPTKIKGFKPKVRVLILEDDPERQQLIGREEEHPDVDIRIQYGIPERNSNFDPSIQIIKKTLGFPVLLNLIDVEVDEQEVLRPRAFVLDPDYLMDVSAVAECFKDFGTEPVLFLLKKYLPFTPNKYLLIGHIANFFLDELMHDPEASFKDLFPQVFKLNPLAFCLFDNAVIREIMQKSQKHFLNLKRMVKEGFAESSIQPEACFLEPSFYSETYGLQGRLDVFYQNGDKSAIVELKSGKAYKPNVYGISSNHFVQTLLYDLLVKSAFGKELDNANYILYSGLEDRQLRFAPGVKAQQFEAIQLRNQLIAIERRLMALGAVEEKELLTQGQQLFGKINPAFYPQIKGFGQKDLALFESVYQKMTAIEKKYFIAYSGFIAREQQLSKTGLPGVDKTNGQAALWLTDFGEKLENFEILNQLKISENRVKEAEPLLIFDRTRQTHPLANFRKGDIAVLYPFGTSNSVLSNQIFKCSIVEINQEQVVARLRSRQFNDALFQQFEYWNLEHDMMDNGFIAMYRGLFEFSQSAPEKKELLLTLQPPKETEPLDLECSDELTGEQQYILKKALAAEDYFLLWGPPGTGKTSMMLRHIVEHLLFQTGENLLLLAYTNRAVDEICESIERISQDMKSRYIRVGSRYSTAERFRGQLLSKKIENIQSRKALKELIDGYRIVVGTVASIGNRPELLQLKKFDRVIIDEASQILEPMLVGLLSGFKRFILIGDHKQLPAVVVQDSDASKVEDADLQGIGLTDLRNSFFERLYKRCMEKGWTWAYAQLSHQGRMHAAIMAFPNAFFYDGTLKILPENVPAHRKQLQPISLNGFTDEDELENLICGERMLFIPTPVDERSTTQKTNRFEAEMIGRLVQSFHRIYDANGKRLTKESIGVITPFRAQIAQIKEVLQELGVDDESLTIDTVERYQGGARDIILISLCTNSLSQLSSLISLSDEGVDRKLNVALTRARQHLVILGNAALLRSDPTYRELIRFCQGS